MLGTGSLHQLPAALAGHRHRFDEGLAIGMAGVPEEGAHGRALDDPPRVEDGDLLAMLGDDAEIAGNEDRRRMEFVDERLDKVEHLRLNRDIEAARRLVRDQQSRIVGQRHRDGNALGHAAAELMRVGVHPRLRIGNTDLAKHEHRVFAGGSLVTYSMTANDVDELTSNRDQRVQRGFRILDDQSDLASPNFLQCSFALAEQVVCPDI